MSATINSLRALGHLARGEPAFRQELALLAVSVPSAWFLSASWRGFALLVGVVLVVLLVETLNSAIEAACNAVSREHSLDIRLAKDCGSLAVAISLAIAGIVWLLALAERVAGGAL